jgi:hydrogenase expression/formation protein HypC
VSEPALGEACTPDGTCTMCSDQDVILRIVRVAPDGSALAEAADGRREEIQVGLVDAVAPGDVVLVHGGVAVVRIRREEPRP